MKELPALDELPVGPMTGDDTVALPPPHSLAAWVDQISQRELPALAVVVQRLQSMVNDEEISLARISELILSDPVLTSRVLAVANSALFNTTGQPISTVSRAAVLLGTNVIRNVCLSLKLIDTLMQPGKVHLMKTLARSFHTAMQARELAVLRGLHRQSEEAFIAGLLLDLGETVFWSCGGNLTTVLDRRLMSLPQPDQHSHERDLMVMEEAGISFRELSHGLAQSWHLGSTVQESIRPSAGARMLNDVRAVQLADQLSDALVLGWHSPAMDKVLQQIARYSGLSLDQVRQHVQATTNKAREACVAFGASALKAYLPDSAPLLMASADTIVDKALVDEALADKQRVGKISAVARGDAALQLSILRELTALMDDKPNINTVLQMVLEGLHRGVGLERAVVALRSMDGHALALKSVIGDDDVQWRGRFVIPLASAGAALEHVIHNNTCCWLGNDARFGQPDQSPVLAMLTGGRQCFLGPITIGRKNIGIFFADGSEQRAQLAAPEFDAFCHFVRQTNLCLQGLAARR